MILWLWFRWQWLRIRWRVQAAAAVFCFWTSTKTRKPNSGQWGRFSIWAWQVGWQCAQAANRTLDLLEHQTNRVNRRAVKAIMRERRM